MAVIYLRSTTGADANNGSTWALAKATLSAAATAAGAGGTVYVSQAHAESSASAIIVNGSGGIATQTRIVCVSDAAEPPTAAATGGSAATTGASILHVFSAAYVRGMTLSAGSGANDAYLNLASYNYGGGISQTYEGCELLVPASGGNAYVWCGGENDTNDQLNSVTFLSCTVKTASTTAPFVLSACGKLRWLGGALKSGQVKAATALIGAGKGARNGRYADVLISGVDLQNMSATQDLFSIYTVTCALMATIRGCRLPASWSGGLWNGPFTPGSRVSMYDCDSGATNYRMMVQDYYGSIRSETTIVRSGGASDGTTPLSWRMASTAQATYPGGPLRSDEIVAWSDVTSGTKTVTVEVVHDSQGGGSGGALTDAECWLEVEYPGSSSYPTLSAASARTASVVTASADHASSGATWTTTGMSTPIKQTLSVSIAPRAKGPILARVCVAKASKTVYVDPLLTVA